MYKNLVTTVISTLVAACFISPVFSQTPATKAPLKIGFVYVAPITEAGKLQPFKARTAMLGNQGREVLAAGKTLSDEQILGMNFLVQGKLSKQVPREA